MKDKKINVKYTVEERDITYKIKLINSRIRYYNNHIQHLLMKRHILINKLKGKYRGKKY